MWAGCRAWGGEYRPLAVNGPLAAGVMHAACSPMSSDLALRRRASSQLVSQCLTAVDWAQPLNFSADVTDAGST